MIVQDHIILKYILQRILRFHIVNQDTTLLKPSYLNKYYIRIIWITTQTVHRPVTKQNKNEVLVLRKIEKIKNMSTQKERIHMLSIKTSQTYSLIRSRVE